MRNWIATCLDVATLVSSAIVAISLLAGCGSKDSPSDAVIVPEWARMILDDEVLASNPDWVPTWDDLKAVLTRSRWENEKPNASSDSELLKITDRMPNLALGVLSRRGSLEFRRFDRIMDGFTPVVAAIEQKYGKGTVVQEGDVTWHIYGPLAAR